jgi:isoquinoline 1-oxidoreductase beta subunit
MKRRTFLSTGAALTASFLAGCTLPVIPKRPAPSLEGARGWISFSRGRYTLFLPRVEMGQNITTALKQVACEELGVDWERVVVRQPATRDIDRVRATVGSESIRDFAWPLAQACAALRDAIAAGQQGGQVETVPRPLESLRLFRSGARWVGQPVPLEDAASIVRGAPLYAADIRRPGMLFGRVLRAAATPELPSRLTGIDEVAARAVPGFAGLVRNALFRHGNSEGIGIAATTPGALDRIEAALAPQWEVTGDANQAAIELAIDIDQRLVRGALSHKLVRDSMESDKPWDIDIRIEVPLAAHGPIEPRAAVAEPGNAGAMNLWVGSQDVFYIRDVVAKRLSIDADRVVVQGCRVGGAFGSKTLCTVELEAAVLAQALGQAVKVQWTRGQEFHLGFHRPPSSHRLRARLKDGKLTDWWHAFASSHILFTNAIVPAWLQRLTDIIGDDGVARGAALPYRAERKRTEFDLVRLPVFTGPWRGLGAGPNVLAIESAIDECARKAGIDALRFRLDNLADERLARVLRRAGEAWSAPQTPATDALRRGRGLACGIYKAMSYAAVVAEVEIDASGGLRVTRMLCAHDCGRVVNPDQVRAQCEGNLVWGLGMVLTDRLLVADRQIAARSFADAPLPRIGDVPVMEVILVDHGEAPTGAGETAIVAAAAAIANAVRAATGLRISRFPVQAADLRTSAA